LQPGQPVDQFLIIAVAIGPGFLDVGQHAAHRVEQRQKGAGPLGIEQQKPVAQAAEQVLADVRDRLQL